MTDTPEELSGLQAAAFNAAMSGRNVFIGGPGGGGKSFVSRRIIDALRGAGKVVAVCGSTGVSAVLVGGVTIHSFLGTGPSDSKQHLRANMSNEQLSRATDRISGVDVILIDEVSMLRGTYFDMMDWWLNLVKGGSYAPFGGLQVIVVGDFLQLPAVTKDGPSRRNIDYAFESGVWYKADFMHFLLTKNFRQEDAEFRFHLMRIRRGFAPPETLDYFNERVGAKPSTLRKGMVATMIMSTNREVDNINLDRLESLAGAPAEFHATYEGNENWIEGIQRHMPCDDLLLLKPGAEVIMKHNHRDGRYVNGTRGIVVACDPGDIRVRRRDNVVVPVDQHTWETKDPYGRVLAAVTQYPVKLAWSSTVHSVQGSTLDEMVFDPKNLFEKAQAYVALSRVRSYEGLSLMSRLKSLHVKASGKVVAWYKAIKERQAEHG